MCSASTASPPATWPPTTRGCSRRSPASGEAARAHGRVLEVCGEAASDPRMIPLLVGFGVTELSVGAARVAATHAAVRALDAGAAAQLARAAVDGERRRRRGAATR